MSHGGGYRCSVCGGFSIGPGNLCPTHGGQVRLNRPICGMEGCNTRVGKKGNRCSVHRDTKRRKLDRKQSQDTDVVMIPSRAGGSDKELDPMTLLADVATTIKIKIESQ